MEIQLREDAKPWTKSFRSLLFSNSPLWCLAYISK